MSYSYSYRRETVGLFNGAKSLSFVTQEIGTPGSYIVRLHEQVTGFKVDERISDAYGNVTFNAISDTAQYYAVLFDNSDGTPRNAVIADRQTPT